MHFMSLSDMHVAVRRVAWSPGRSGRRFAWFTLLLGGLVALVFGAPIAQAAQRQIFWANNNGGTVGSANLDGSGVNGSIVTGARSLFGIAADAQHVFWTNQIMSAIGEAHPDGTGVNQAFITGASSPQDVTVNSQHIYWTNGATNTIGRANLDGSGVDQTFITASNGVEGVAVDGQHIYWTSYATNTIGRANLDGTDVNQSFITGANGPLRVAVDARHVLWSNNNAGAIGAANLDGTAVNQTFINTQRHPDGLADDGQHIYWGDAIGRIGEADLAGTVINPALITGTDTPTGVALAASAAVQANVGTLTFLPQPQGTLSAPQTVTLTDTGNAPLTVAGLSFAGADAGDYIIGSSTCLAAIPASQSCQFTVNFSPQAQGARTATLQIASNDPLSPTVITLAGSGSAAPQGATGPQGPRGPAGPRGKTGSRGQIELVMCTTRHRHSVCSARLVSGPVKFTATSRSTTATLTRGHTLYAIGTTAQTTAERQQLILRPLHRLTRGRYTLTVTRRHGGRSKKRRSQIELR